MTFSLRWSSITGKILCYFTRPMKKKLQGENNGSQTLTAVFAPVSRIDVVNHWTLQGNGWNMAGYIFH